MVSIESDNLGDGAGARLTVRGPRVVSDARLGDSIAVNGCCLTVAAHDAETFVVDVIAETLDRTSIGALSPGAPVNLERAMRAGERLGGHLVQGHVDGTGTVLERANDADPGTDGATLGERVRISLPAQLARYVAPQGSITVDGVSLTVVSVRDEAGATPPHSFTVGLIPTTLAETTLGAKPVGSVVNLEIDVIARYVERLQSVSTHDVKSGESR